jgi:hypothetical protein
MIEMMAHKSPFLLLPTYLPTYQNSTLMPKLDKGPQVRERATFSPFLPPQSIYLPIYLPSMHSCCIASPTPGNLHTYIHTYVRTYLHTQVEELYDHRDKKCNVPANFDLCEDANVIDDPSLQVGR